MLKERPHLLSHLRATELFNAPPGAVVRIAPFANVKLYVVHSRQRGAECYSLLRSHGAAEFTVAYLRFMRYACSSCAFLSIQCCLFTRPHALTNACQAADVEGLEDHLGQFVADGEYLVRTSGIWLLSS